MPAKCREVPERCCMHFPQVDSLSSRIRQDRGSPRTPEAAGSTIARAPDIGGAGSERKSRVKEFPEIPPQEGMIITISAIEGFSQGLAHQMSKSCITVGRIGGGADFEFDDPEASDVAAREDGVRIYHGVSTTGIYIRNRRISTVELKHMSTFRVGSSLFQVSVLPNCQRVEIG